jgi:hypothetical protein
MCALVRWLYIRSLILVQFWSRCVGGVGLVFGFLERFFYNFSIWMVGICAFLSFVYEFTLSKTPAPCVCYCFTPVWGFMGYLLYMFFLLPNYTTVWEDRTEGREAGHRGDWTPGERGASPRNLSRLC